GLGLGPGKDTLEARMLPPVYHKESKAERLARTQGLWECLDIRKACEQQVVWECSRACLADVCRFVEGWRYSSGCGDDSGSKSNNLVPMGRNDLVPVALVDTGLHLGDRAQVANLVRRGLTINSGPGAREKVVLILRPEACPSLEATMSGLLQQCLEVGGNRPSHPLPMHAIREWYNSLYPDTFPGL
ncbi:unnamed protein product, partial [Discosporangium mesarthrocarpum]